MLKGALNEISGMRIHATDGDLGHVHDVYIDDGRWRVRYVHVDTGYWLLGRHVLLAPSVVRWVDWEGGVIHTTLSRQQIRDSPDIETHRPVPEQHQPRLAEYFQCLVPIVPAATWQGEEMAARLHALLLAMHVPTATTTDTATDDDAHLWSVRGLSHYAVEGKDADLGRVDDVLVHPTTWTVPALVGDAGGLLATRRFLVAVEQIQWISADARRIRVALASANRTAAA